MFCVRGSAYLCPHLVRPRPSAPPAMRTTSGASNILYELSIRIIKVRGAVFARRATAARGRETW